MNVDRSHPYLAEVATVLQLISRDCARGLKRVGAAPETLAAATEDPWPLIEADMADRSDRDLQILVHLDPSSMALSLLGIKDFGAGSRAIARVYEAYLSHANGAVTQKEDASDGRVEALEVQKLADHHSIFEISTSIDGAWQWREIDRTSGRSVSNPILPSSDRREVGIERK